MNPLTFIFQQFIYIPLLNLLVFFYNLPLVDFGGAIILLTFLTKALTWKLDTHAIIKQREAQIQGAEVQEEMKKIKEKYKDDQVKQNEEIMKIWREKKFNPFSSFVPLIVQFVIIIALFQLLRNSIGPAQLNMVYSFIQKPVSFSPIFLRYLDLSKPNIILAVLTGIAQFIYSKMTFDLQKKNMPKKKKDKKEPEKENSMQKVMQNQMLYFLPLLIVFMYAKFFPSAVALYWLLATIIGIVQMKFFISKKIEEQAKK